MVQPFQLDRSCWSSQVWPGLKVERRGDHLLIDSSYPLKVLSSAVWGGGLGKARFFVNWKVPLDFHCSDPMEEFLLRAVGWGYPSSETVGLLTAAELKDASVQEEEGDQFSMVCCATAGTSNSARAGRMREVFPAYACGTINIFVLIDGRLTEAAMVNALITATEAKAAALQDLGITDEAGEAATGTTTDSLVVGASFSERYGETHLFAGTATSIGNAVGRLVYQAVYEAAGLQGERQKDE